MKRKNNEHSNGRKSLRYRGIKCLNCEHPLDKSDIYCPYCSQRNSTKKLSLTDFFEQFFSSIFVYDSRLRSTFKDLLFRPGKITLWYVRGQRLKYANPFRFFLSVSIIFFLVSGLLDIINTENNVNEANQDFIASPADRAILDSLGFSVNRAATAIKKVDSIKSLKPEKPIDYLSESELDSLPWMKSYAERLSIYNDFYEKYKIKNAAVAMDSLHHKNTSFNRWVYKKNATAEKIRENPSEFINYVISKVPFFLFFYAPLYALFFWLIYSRKKYTYMEHLVFIFHIFSFIFLAMLLSIIPDLLLDWQFFVGSLFLIIGPIYFYKALRNFYQQSRIVTLIKFVFLNAAFIIGLTIATIIFVIASAALY
ncbi:MULTISPECIES: DUF3667 domain-containing protein [Aequorivita]|uniref:DUF3667 domain-containing protein n=2 Tax=Aequorivita TaxID=153265 RepID=A0AB35YTB4_9FLAO|nr:DUF3667 domain-containing protein [Aequorivita sp. Ant34-E75]WGF94069.1 DUF3667 domain-containing protein [Aequorivita sp. Ant34-E75]